MNLPPEIEEQLAVMIASTGSERKAHDAAHMINLLAESANKLAELVSLGYGASTVQGLLQAIDQQVGLLESVKATKQ